MWRYRYRGGKNVAKCAPVIDAFRGSFATVRGFAFFKGGMELGSGSRAGDARVKSCVGVLRLQILLSEFAAKRKKVNFYLIDIPRQYLKNGKTHLPFFSVPNNQAKP